MWRYVREEMFEGMSGEVGYREAHIKIWLRYELTEALEHKTKTYQRTNGRYIWYNKSSFTHKILITEIFKEKAKLKTEEG